MYHVSGNIEPFKHCFPFQPNNMYETFADLQDAKMYMQDGNDEKSHSNIRKKIP